MLLTADIGNTNITLGLFDNKELVNVLRIETDKNYSENEYKSVIQQKLKNYNIDGCIIASVVDEITLKIKNICEDIFKLKPIVVDSNIQTENVVNFSKFPTLGADRIANSYAAYKLYKSPVIIVDLGTATTFEIISSQGKFSGGIIMPGLELQLKALNLYTSKLPKIEIMPIEKTIGFDTGSFILSGVIRGSANAISGLIEQCEKELGQKAYIVATGGYAGIISDYMKRKFDDVNQNLTLQGLYQLYKLNQD